MQSLFIGAMFHLSFLLQQEMALNNHKHTSWGAGDGSPPSVEILSEIALIGQKSVLS